MSGFQYTTTGTVVKLSFFPHAEGYVNNTVVNGANVYNYVFNYTDHLGNIRLSYAKDPTTNVLKIIEENHYYPFGLKHTNYNSDYNMFQKAETNVIVLKKPIVQTRLEYQIKYQGQERQDELGLNWDSFKWRNYDYAIGRFMCIDPLAEKYAYNSTYAFQENKMGMGRELEGLELVEWGFLLETTQTPNLSPITEALLKPEVIETGTKFSETTLENFSRGRATEVEQLSKNGLEKNTESITRLDPKTGKEGTTIPDAIKKDGATVEIKDVKNQSLTRQLRLQKAESESNGVKPELIINQTAKLSEPLKKAGFEIKTYQNNTVIDNTAVKKPDLPKPAPKKKEPEYGPEVM